jgi:hypothetical protein
MRTLGRFGFVSVIFALAGCLGDEAGRDPFTLRNPFKQKPAEPKLDLSTAPAASVRTATRVHTVGNAVVAANSVDMRTKPVFMTVGVTEPMLFHRRSGEIIISEGLVERCNTDGELAAVLCHEMGKLAAERDDRPPLRSETDLPPAPPLSPDVVGGGQPPDMTRMAEEAKFNRRNNSGSRGPREAKPDAKALAQNFLSKAGQKSEDLDRMQPLLKEAEENAEKRTILRGR